MSRRLDSAALRFGVVDIDYVLAVVMEEISQGHCQCKKKGFNDLAGEMKAEALGLDAPFSKPAAMSVEG